MEPIKSLVAASRCCVASFQDFWRSLRFFATYLLTREHTVGDMSERSPLKRTKITHNISTQVEAAKTNRPLQTKDRARLPPRALAPMFHGPFLRSTRVLLC